MNKEKMAVDAFYSELDEGFPQDDKSLMVVARSFCTADAVDQQIVDQRRGLEPALTGIEEFLVPIKMRSQFQGA